MNPTKLLVLTSSYRKNGNTASTAALVVEQLAQLMEADQQPLEIETINIARQEIGMCRGCRICFNKSENLCPLHEDDFLSIKAKMQAADVLLVASPIYVDDVNGVMKNFIDRMAHVCHRPEFAGKSVYLLTTVGSSRGNHALRTLDTAFRTWGYYIIGKANFLTGAYMRRSEIEAKYAQQTAESAQAIYCAVSEQKVLNPTFVSLMMFKIQQMGWSNAKPGTVDHEYWAGKGWLDPNREFYIPNRAGRLKVAAARLTGRVVARLFADV